MLNKKSQFFNLFLVLGFLVFMIASYRVLSVKQFDYVQDGYVGERQVDLFNRYADAEKAVNYITDSAVISSQQSLYDLGNQGGSAEMENSYYGFTLWSNESTVYNLDNIPNNFVSIFNNNLNSPLDIYEANFRLKKNNYKINITEDRILATPVAPITVKVGQGAFYDGKLEYFPVKEKYYFENDWGYERPGGRLHEGTDIFAPMGTPVIASVSGRIERIGCNEWGGNRIGVRDSEGNYFYYAHLEKYGINTDEDRVWRVGDTINAGEILGTVGDNLGCYTDCDSTKPGNTCGIPDNTQPHLHFGIYQDQYNGRAVNPFNALQESLGRDVETTFGTVGLYSRMPYFNIPFEKSSLNYSAYVRLAKQLSDTCNSKQDLTVTDSYALSECVANEAAFNGWQMSYQCDKLDPLRSFREQLDSCLNSKDDGCECEIFVEGSEFEIIKNGSKTFAVLANQQIEITDIENVQRGFISNLFISDVEDKLVVHKENNILSSVNSVDNECRLDDRTFKMCIPTYNEVLTSEGIQNVSINFALYINDSSPPPAIEVSFPKTIPRTALLSFKQSPSPDIDHYVVYYKPLVDLKKVSDAFREEKLVLSTVQDATTESDMVTHPDVFYFDKETKTYYKPIQVSLTETEGKIYHFAVVGVDKFGNQLYDLDSFSVRLFP